MEANYIDKYIIKEIHRKELWLFIYISIYGTVTHCFLVSFSILILAKIILYFFPIEQMSENPHNSREFFLLCCPS